MTIRTIIVDDEELARRGIHALARQASDVEVIAECCNGLEAVEGVLSLAPDLVFLDIHMPGMNGFEVIEALGVRRCPYIIFVTAFDHYARRAFDVHALDYLLKPIDERRFGEAMSRARAALAPGRDSDLSRRLAQLFAEIGPPDPDIPAYVDRIPVKDGSRVVVLRVAEIDWIEADGDYVELHAGTKTWLLREAIGAVETRLAPARFVRIHRSVLVNVDRVREMHPRTNGDITVVLSDGTELKLSRNYRDSIPRIAGAKL